MSASRVLKSVRPLLTTTGAALLASVALAAPAAARVSVVAAGDADTGSGRLGAIVAALVALTGILVGGLALAGSTGRIGPRVSRGTWRWAAFAAMASGLLGVILAALHLADSTGGIGTGNGRAGAMVAVVLGLIAMALGGMSLRSARRPA
ncbi:DUF6223 family protein [Streptomyces sp. NPDC048560]|uniref:DUF6223 family protein n=1 Tax=Streptomyces sp. NPDC048560 TaxID=3155488 RepID=UPI0034370881